jgi:4-amino-4-deoxy-L-arabinose transferase-like glycosyltransferase
LDTRSVSYLFPFPLHFLLLPIYSLYVFFLPPYFLAAAAAAAAAAATTTT